MNRCMDYKCNSFCSYTNIKGCIALNLHVQACSHSPLGQSAHNLSYILLYNLFINIKYII